MRRPSVAPDYGTQARRPRSQGEKKRWSAAVPARNFLWYDNVTPDWCRHWM